MKKYCMDNGEPCQHLRKFQAMAETGMDGGVYMPNGWYYQCTCHNTYFPVNTTEEALELYGCTDSEKKR